MPTSRLIRKKVDIYASTLLEFAQAAGTEVETLSSLECVCACSDEVTSTLLTLCEMGKRDLLPGVTAAFGALAATRRPDEGSEASIVASVLLQAAQAEGHSPQRILGELESLADLTPEVLDALAVIGTGSDRRLLDYILARYHQDVDEHGRTMPVEVTTAVPLDDGLRAQIEAKMEAEFGRPVSLIERTDPSILGGLVVSANGETRDASVRAQLARMRDILQTPSTGGENE